MITVPGSIPKIILLFCCNRVYFCCVTMKENKSIKILLKYFLGPVLFGWLFWTVYKQLASSPDIIQQWSLLKEGFAGVGLFFLIGVVLLMFFQWFLEAYKWKLMLKPLVAVGLIQSLRTIFSGIAFSIVTPNRFGEFAGRILHLPAGTRLQGTAFTFIGNLAQLIITCVAGFFSLLVNQSTVRNSLGQFGMGLTVEMLLLSTPFLVIGLLLLFFGSRYVVAQLMKFAFLQRYQGQFSQLATIPLRTLFLLMGLSAFRFVVFIVQYWILFQFVGIDFMLGTVFGYVSVMLLWLAIVPTFSVLELGLRWQFALVLFTPLSTNILGIAFVVTTVWMVNFILPALLGAMAVVGYRADRTPIPQ